MKPKATLPVMPGQVPGVVKGDVLPPIATVVR